VGFAGRAVNNVFSAGCTNRVLPAAFKLAFGRASGTGGAGIPETRFHVCAAACARVDGYKG
jgi:hypothetical protein